MMSAMLRLGVVAALLIASAMLRTPSQHRDAFARESPTGVWAGAPAGGAPAGMGTNSLTFATDVDDRANAVRPQTEFSSHTERVWATFAYRDYSGESMSYLVRANGEDWRWGDLDCCEGQGGQFAFPIERRSNNDLGGAAYDVFIYANNAEVGHAGFGVRGTQGFDDNDGDDNGNSNGNDND
jgi:hypothetical protein